MQLQDHITRLRKEIPDVAASWSRVENIHLTLKFFGNVNVDRIEAITAAIDRAVKDVAPFDIGIGKTGTFRTQVLWIGVSDPSGKLTVLHQRLGSEDRAYQPHLTIARIRRHEGAKRLVDAHRQMQFENVSVRVKYRISSWRGPQPVKKASKSRRKAFLILATVYPSGVRLYRELRQGERIGTVGLL